MVTQESVLSTAYVRIDGACALNKLKTALKYYYTNRRATAWDWVHARQ